MPSTVHAFFDNNNMGFFTTNSDSEKENVPSHGLPVPGTVHLVDLEGTMRAKHAKGSLHDVVLVPAPSADPDDPVSKKFLLFLSLFLPERSEEVSPQLFYFLKKLTHSLSYI